jgi:nucleosome binding factor SPN SPT16 subunit
LYSNNRVYIIPYIFKKSIIYIGGRVGIIFCTQIESNENKQIQKTKMEYSNDESESTTESESGIDSQEDSQEGNSVGEDSGQESGEDSEEERYYKQGKKRKGE